MTTTREQTSAKSNESSRRTIVPRVPTENKPDRAGSIIIITRYTVAAFHPRKFLLPRVFPVLLFAYLRGEEDRSGREGGRTITGGWRHAVARHRGLLKRRPKGGRKRERIARDRFKRVRFFSRAMLSSRGRFEKRAVVGLINSGFFNDRRVGGGGWTKLHTMQGGER